MLARTLAFSAEKDGSLPEQIPSAAAVFVLRGQGEPYVSKTANLRRRLQRLLGPAPEQSKRLNLRDHVREIEYTPTGSDFESQLLLYRVLRQTFPNTYAKRLRLRPAPLVKLHLENEYPRVSVTTRLGKLRRQECSGAPDASSVLAHTTNTGGPRPSTPGNLYYGPFPSRTVAEKFASDALDFFKMRRCIDDLHPDPSFPGCIYSEMQMCLAPCFKGCTDEEYDTEVTRVQKFLDSRGDSLTREFVELRERASQDLAFEEAAAVHARLEKLKPSLNQLPEIVQRIDQLDAIVIQPSSEPNSVLLFRFHNAQFAGPMMFKIEPHGNAGVDTQASRPQTMEARVEQIIGSLAAERECLTTERSEQLAILKRWYYRSNRVGEIFFAEEKGSWPLRRIVRGIGRVYRGEKQQELAPFAATSNNASPSEAT